MQILEPHTKTDHCLLSEWQTLAGYSRDKKTPMESTLCTKRYVIQTIKHES